jgi:hypothetical protein
MRLNAKYRNLLQKERGQSRGFELNAGYKNTKLSTQNLYKCRESKILVLVRRKHSVMQIRYCAQIDEFLPKVSSRCRCEYCEILNCLINLHEVKETSCYYEFRQFVAIITYAFPSRHLQPSPKYIS